MNVIKRKTIIEYYTRHPDSRASLESWYHEADKAKWHGPADVKKRYPSADIIGENRIVFNIHGNRYRLIVKVAYTAGIVYIRFIGTHAEYSKIDAETK